MSKFDRQSFLGELSDERLKGMVLAIPGLGGGGSHIVQQAAHIGIGNFVLIDPDYVDAEGTNLHRLVGATEQDVIDQTPKVDIAERLIRSIRPGANIIKLQDEWQAVSDHLKRCDVIIGGLDSIRAKAELEGFARRFMIPYIDMGMDVHEAEDSYLISGQVVLSCPGTPCLRCCGIVSDASLQEEARNYGAAGAQQQVIWPNAILASTAIGLMAQLFVPWQKRPVDFTYIEYDGNQMTLGEGAKGKMLKERKCPHYLQKETGDPCFDIRSWCPENSEDELFGIAASFWPKRL